jgi:hypothetical protein
MRNRIITSMFHAIVWINQLAERAVTCGADELRTRLGTLLLPLKKSTGPSHPHNIHTFQQFDNSSLTVPTSKTLGLDWEETLGKDVKGELHKYYSDKLYVLMVKYGNEFALSKRLNHKILMHKTKFYVQMTDVPSSLNEACPNCLFRKILANISIDFRGLKTITLCTTVPSRSIAIYLVS